MKIETRGKYPGVKVHLDPDEIEVILATNHMWHPDDAIEGLLQELRKYITKLMKVEPYLLAERTPEQIAAILAKESEKAALQLKALQAGAEWKKVDPDALNAAMSKLVNKQ